MADNFEARRRQMLAAHEELQKHADPEARAMIEVMKGQLLIVLVERLGGDVVVPASEIDATGDHLLMFSADDAGRFRFSIQRKN